MIDHLPPDSHFIAALAEDDEAAEHVDLDAKPKPPKLTEFGPEVQALAALHDRIGALIQVTWASTGKSKAPRLQPYPRPVLAIERRRRRQRLDKHERIKGLLLRQH